MNSLKIFITLLIIFIFSSKASAAVIIYPKSENTTIDADVTFFVGNEDINNTLRINSEPVELHSSGGFFYPVNLKYGENIFNIDNGVETKVYTIFRPENKKQHEKYVVERFNAPQIYEVSKDNVPLRSIPYDGGINRLQHFDKGVLLSVVGDYKQFYKVQLARDDFAWIDKSYVKQSVDNDYKPAQINSYTYEENDKYKTYKIKLNKKVPYILTERIAYDLVKNQYESKTVGLDLVIYNIENLPEHKYELYIPKKDKLFGYKSYYTNDNELVIQIKNTPSVDNKSPLKDKTITIDPGHGGSEIGAVGCLGDYEKNINLKIALRLKDYLQQAGANVVMTRNDDSYVSLSDRVEISQNNNSDIFISIHNNALGDSEAKSNRSGASAYYFYPQSKELASTMLKVLTKELSMNDDKLRQRSFAVVRNTQSPSILLEIGYMIKPTDNAKLIRSDFQDKAAKAIYDGLEKYLNDL